MKTDSGSVALTSTPGPTNRIRSSSSPRPSTMPASWEVERVPPTPNFLSSRSCTTEEMGVTWITRPTSRGPSDAPVTTGMFTATPSSDPAPIVIVHSKFDTPLAITRAGIVRDRIACRPRICSRSSIRPASSWLSCCAVLRSSICASSASFRSASEGSSARLLKKSLTGCTTLETAFCIGASALLTARPAASSGPPSPAR